MAGQTQTQQNQTQNSSTSPWTPAQPMLNGVLNQVGQANTGPTAGQTAATGQVVGEASNTPSYGTQGENAVNNLFNSSTAPQQGMLSDSYNQTQAALSPELQASYLNPMTAPGMGDALNTMNSDITNQINGSFAAAGRPAGTNADSSQALARGLSQGEGSLLTNEFNALQGNQNAAAGALSTAAGNTATGITNQQQTQLGNGVTGMTASTAIPGMLTQPGVTALNAQNLQAALPTSNLANIESLLNPVASLGSQSTGTSTGTTTTQQPLAQTLAGAAMGGLGLLGGTGAFGTTGYLTNGIKGLLGTTGGS